MNTPFRLRTKLLFVFLFASVVVPVGLMAPRLSVAQTAHPASYHFNHKVYLPDPDITPGVIRTTDAAELCAPRFRTKPFRKTTQAMKDQVYKAYGVERNKGICAGGCEVDHLVPLELGGLDDVRNLWPQPSRPAPGFHQKDKLENQLKADMCTGRITAAEAQHELAVDWYAAYLTKKF